MSKNKISIIFIIVIIFIAVILFLTQVEKTKTLVNPGGLLTGKTESLAPAPTPAPPNAPKTFKFDSSTDLDAELEKVDPQVLDSDFE